MSTTPVSPQQAANKGSVVNRQAILGFGWFGVGVIGALISYISLDSDPALSSNPMFWPMMCSLIMAGSGLIIGLQGALNVKQETQRASQVDTPDDSVKSTDKDSPQSGEPVVRRWSHLYLFAALLIYVLIMPELGYVLATFLFLAFTLWGAGFRSFWKGPLIAAILTMGTAYLFGELLSIALPRGSGVLYMLDGIFF